MRKQDAMKQQGHTCVLRVDNIHCDGCKGKVRKLLMKIDGVYATSIDMEQGKVAVTGNVDPAVLIRKLEKLGKHAEIWRNNHNSNNNNNSKSMQFDVLNNQFKSLQMANVKGGGGDKKLQYKGGKDHQIKYQPLVQEMKGSQDMKAPFKMKDQKTVKFDLPKKAHGGFDEFSEGDEFDEDDDFGDEDGDFDEEFDDGDDEEFEYGGRQPSQKPVNGDQTKNGKAVGKEKKGGKKAKKGGGGFMSMIGKAIGGKGKGKDGKVGKKCGSGGKIKGKVSGIQKHGGGGEGKVGNKGGGGKGGYNTNIGQKGGGGGQNGMFSDFEVSNHHNKGGGMGQIRTPGPQGPRAPQMMNMNGGGRGGGGGGNGYYPSGGVGPMGPMTSTGNPYQQQQQQYMAMIMNQQRMMNVGGDGGDMMYHPAMYGRPPPGYGYAPPMLPPSPARAYHQDPYAHMFSDENTGSCSIM